MISLKYVVSHIFIYSQVRSGLTEKVENEKGLDFSFSDPGKLSPPVLQCNDITFGYPSCEILYSGMLTSDMSNVEIVCFAHLLIVYVYYRGGFRCGP